MAVQNRPARAGRRGRGGDRGRLLRAVLAERLEHRRLMAADVLEAEPNNSLAQANPITVGAAPLVVGGSINPMNDADFFSFTLSARSGVFLDVDARDTRLSFIDSRLTLYDASGVQIAANDDGWDFDGFTVNDNDELTRESSDSSLYADLPAGSYKVRVSPFGSLTGAYELKVRADSSYTSGPPVLASNPGATDTIHLDFDGHAASGDAWNNGNAYTLPAFDLNGNGAEWTPLERLAVTNAWAVVADDFAPFNVNVTTSFAGPYADGVAYRQVIGNTNGSQIGQSGPQNRGAAVLGAYNAGGAANQVGFTFVNTVPKIQGNEETGDGLNSDHGMARPIAIGNLSSREIAKAMNLRRYTGAAQINAITYNPQVGITRRVWHAGTSEAGAQDDLATLSSVAINTFGYRPDEHGNTRAAATPLAGVSGVYETAGVLHQTSDVDVFRFAGAGTTSVRLTIPEHLNNLDGEVHLYNSAGTLIASADGVDLLSASLTASLPAAGDYFVEVRSDGGQGEIGQYALRITTSAAGAGAGSIAGRAFRDADYDQSFEPAQGDAALEGVVVYLDADNDNTLDPGETSTTTAADGTYAFNGLADGPYTVRQITPDDYAANLVRTPTVAGGGAVTGQDFGSFKIVYDGSGDDDSFTVRLKPGDATKIQVIEALAGSAVITNEAPRTLVTQLGFFASAGFDLLTVDADSVPVGNVAFNGGSDFDELVVNGAGANDTLGVTATAISRQGDAGSVLYSFTENVTVNGGLGNDTFNVTSTHADAPVDLHGDGGDDTFNAGLGNLDPLEGDLLVNGGDGAADALFVDDSSTNFSDGYEISATAVNRDFASAVTYAQLEGLTLIAQAGDNNVLVNSTAANTPVTVVGNDGSDFLFLNGYSSLVTFQGGLNPADEDHLHVNAGLPYVMTADVGLTTANLTLNVNNSSSVTFDASQRLAALNIVSGSATLAASGSRAVNTGTLTIGIGAHLDLKDNNLVVRSGAVGTFAAGAYTDVSGMIHTGRGDGTWNGSGILTTQSHADTGLTSLGVRLASELLGIAPGDTTVWEGQTVTGDSVLVKYTYAGDADLNGTLDSDDYFAIDSNFNLSGSVFGWAVGDFDYNGAIDSDDYFLIDSNWNNQILGTL